MNGKPLDDKQVVLAFIDYLQKNGHSGLKVDRIPDDENRASADVDAIAGEFAIEHTSIDTVRNQRRDSDWFKKVVGELGAELSAKMTIRLKIAIPYHGIKKEQNWSEIRNALRSWIINVAPNLPDGQQDIQNLNIPFDFHIVKESDLLVESGDSVLTHWPIMLKAIQVAYGGNLPKDVDHIWYVDTSIPSDFEFWDFTQMLQSR